MATLSARDIGDLITGTLNELGWGRFNEIAASLQEYEAFRHIMRKNKVKFSGGQGIQRTLMWKHSGAARNVGLYQTDSVDVQDVLVTIDVPWRHTETSWAYDVREIFMNASKEKIVDLIKVRRADAMLSLAERMEEDFWTKPSSSTDTTQPFGILYWLDDDNTEGFNGGAVTGFTAGPGGLDPATYTNWKNYTGQYTNVTKDDLIDKMRTGYRKIRFMSPVNVPDFRRGRGDQYRIYVNETTINAFERLGEAQNENLGRDLAPYDDTMSFRRNPIVWVPQLDANADLTDPVFMINWAFLYPVCLRRDWMRETGPRLSARSHNIYEMHIDNSWNLLCTDRRRQAVFDK